MRFRITVSGTARMKRLLENRRKSAESVVYAIEYTAPHAMIVHERLDLYHQPPTQAKFVEEPFRRLRRDMANWIAGAIISHRRTLRQAVYQATQKLFSVTQRFVPVDTGELKTSGRIVREK